MKIVFFGTPAPVLPILETLMQTHTVLAVVSTPDKKAGRKQLLTPSPVKKFATEHSLPVITPEEWNDETIEQIQTLQPDLFVVAAYGKILPKKVLDIPPFGAICVHPSLLPKYRGPSPIPAALLHGDKITGTSLIKMDEKMDHGPILHTAPFTIHETDTYETLMNHLFQLGATILPEAIENYVHAKTPPQPQDDNHATYTKLVTKQDGYLDLSKIKKLNALEIGNWKLEIARKIRAYYPWPSVWSMIRIKNQEVRIKFLPPQACHSPQASPDTSSFCIQVEGKNPMSVKDFLNGYPEIGEKLQSILL